MDSEKKGIAVRVFEVSNAAYITSSYIVFTFDLKNVLQLGSFEVLPLLSMNT